MGDQFVKNWEVIFGYFRDRPQLTREWPVEDKLVTYAVGIGKAMDEGGIQFLGTPLDKSEAIKKNVYEGGFKIWECEKDAVNFLAEDPQLKERVQGASILELGCGSGLMGSLIRDCLSECRGEERCIPRL